MKFLALVEITPEKMVIWFDKDTILDTGGFVLTHQHILEWALAIGQPRALVNKETVLEHWDKERL